MRPVAARLSRPLTLTRTLATAVSSAATPTPSTSSASASSSSSAFVPFSALPPGSSAFPKPPLQTWYMGKPALSAFLMTLQDALKTSRASLYRAGYLASVDAPSSLPGQVPSAKWITAEEMATQLQISRITLSYYRKITALLIELNNLHPLLNKLDREALGDLQGNAAGIEGMLKRFKKPDARNVAILGQGGEITTPQKSRKQGYLDPSTGIAYGLGKKKESSVRAWIVPVQSSSNTSSPDVKEEVDLGPRSVFDALEGQTQSTSTASDASSSSSSAKPQSQEAENDNDFSFTPPPSSSALSLRSKSGIDINDLPIGRILCNNQPISSYFHTAAERSVVLRPFSLTDCIGKYNVFLLLRGGGISSQATAASVACARALAAAGLEEGHPERKAILSKADLLRRDPRVVERKKTGRPKARKRFTWVKR